MPNHNTGIYKITNTVNGKCYVGGTMSLVRRFKEHLVLLKANKHHSITFQRAWNKYGENSFIFEILLICSKDRLRFYEQVFLDHLKSYVPKNGYNINIDSGSNLGRKMSEETKEKMRQAKLGKPGVNKGCKFTEEHRKRLSESHKGQQPWPTGKPLPEEHRRKLSESLKGRKVWNKGLKLPEITGENHPFYGGSHSPETKLKMSIAAKNRPSNRKGVKLSEEMKQKLRGRRLSVETRLKMSLAAKARWEKAHAVG